MRNFYCLLFLVVLLSSCGRLTGLHQGDLLLHLDTAKINKWMVIHRGKMPDAYSVVRQGGNWQIDLEDDQNVAPDTGYIRRSLEHFSNLPVLRSIDTPKAVWNALGVGDTGIVVKIFVGEKPTDSLIIGKLDFFNSSKAHFYVRRQGDNHIYLVDKYLYGSFAAPVQEIRKKAMTVSNPQEITAIHILSASSDPVTLEINSGQWVVDGKPANKTAIVNYLFLIGNLRSNAFTKRPEKGADYSIIVNGINGKESVIKVYRTEDGYAMESSVNKGNFLKLTNEQFAILFPDRSSFLSQ
jgi:hypothetical protein